MGSIGAIKVWQVLKNVQTVIAIELMVAAQGLDFAHIHPVNKQIMPAGAGVQKAYDLFRNHVKHLDRDRVLYDDIQIALGLVKNDDFLNAVEAKIGGLA